MRIPKEEVIKRMHSVIDDLDSKGIEVNKNRVIKAYEFKYDYPVNVSTWIGRCPEIFNRIREAMMKSVCWDESIKNHNKWRAYGEKKRKALEDERTSEIERWKSLGAVTELEGACK